MEISKIKKRNGSIVDFDRTRIEHAIEKACVPPASPSLPSSIPR